MVLTILAIPLIFLGVFIRPYTLGTQRCFNVDLFSKAAYCFEQSSQMPEIVKYGCMVAGVVLIYAGRQQIKRSRGA